MVVIIKQQNISHSLSVDIFILSLDVSSKSRALVQQEITNLKQKPLEKILLFITVTSSGLQIYYFTCHLFPLTILCFCAWDSWTISFVKRWY